MFDVIIYAWFTYAFESADRSGAGGEQAMFLPLYGIMQEKPEKAIMKKFSSIIKKQPPARLITIGFALAILAGTLLLLLPVSVKEGAEVGFVDALFTSTSAVCVTGLIAIDVADHFTLFGQIIVALLIQIGGLGVTSVGMGFIIAAGRKVGFKGRLMVKEALNVDSFKGIVRLVKAILLVTLCFEVAGAALSFISFRRDFPLPEAVWKSIFHSIAAFNNAGFDILGGMRNLIPYQTDVLLNLTTCFLIIFDEFSPFSLLRQREATLFDSLCAGRTSVLGQGQDCIDNRVCYFKIVEIVPFDDDYPFPDIRARHMLQSPHAEAGQISRNRRNTERNTFQRRIAPRFVV